MVDIDTSAFDAVVGGASQTPATTPTPQPDPQSAGSGAPAIDTSAFDAVVGQSPHAGGSIDTSAFDTVAHADTPLPESIRTVNPSENVPGVVSDSELEQIAKARGVDPSKLTQYGPMLGARVGSGDQDTSLPNNAKRVAWGLANSLSLGRVPRLYESLATDGQTKQALDDMRQLLEYKQATSPHVVDRPDAHIENVVTPGELNRIATEHGVDADKLADWAGVFQASVTDPDHPAGVFANLPKKMMWGVLDHATGGLAADAYKKLAADSPEMGAAVDDLESLINNKQDKVSQAVRGVGHLATQIALTGGAGELAAGSLGAGATGVKVAGKAAEVASAVGQGLVQAPQGEEKQGVILNLAMLGGFHLVGGAVGAARTAAADSAVKALVESPRVQAAVDSGAERMRANANAEMSLQKGVTSAATSAEELAQHLTPEEIQHIAQLQRTGGTGAVEPARAAAAAEPHAEQVVELAEHPEQPESSGPPAIYPGSPNDEMAEVALQLPRDGTPESDVQRAYSYVQETRSKLSDVIGAGGSHPEDLQAALEDPTRGPDLVGRRFLDMRRAEYTLSAIRDAGLDQSTGAGRDLHVGPIRRIGMFFSDARHVYDAIDNRYGTETVTVLDKLSRGYNGYTLALEEANARAAPLLEQTNKLMDSTTQSGAKFGDVLYKSLADGHFSSGEFSPEQIQVLRGWRDHFNWLANNAEQLHTQFPELDLTPVQVVRNTAGPEASYVPHYVKGGPEFVAAMRGEMRETGLNSGMAIFDAASKGDARAVGLLRGLELWNSGDITSVQQANSAYNKMVSLQRTGEAVNTSARSLFARTGQVPDFLLEKDVQRLASSWTQNTYRHLFLRNPLSQLAMWGSTLNEVNPGAGKYITDHVKDVAGLREGTLSTWMTTQRSKWIAHAMDKAERSTGVAKAWWGMLSHVDDISNSIFSNMYAGFLGARPDAALRYMAQPFFTATPHLAAMAPADALRRISTAYTKAMGEFADSEARGGLREAITRAGRLPAEQAFEAQQYLRSGLESSGAARFWSKMQGGADAVNHFSMGLFRAADLVGRVVTKHLAEGIIEDAAAHVRAHAAGIGDSIAQTAERGKTAAMAIQNASPGYRSAIQRALRAGDEDTARDLMTQFMTSHTQQDYNRIAMSEFGRSMGGIFSMFSKWPTSVLGETLGVADAKAIHKPLNGGQTRVLTKYLAPLAVAYWLNESVWQPYQEEQSTDAMVARQFVGKDLTGWVPGDSLRSVLSGGLAHSPPGTDLIRETGAGLTTGDPSRALAAAADLAVSGMPFGVVVKKLLLEWGPALTGEQPISVRHEVETGVRDNIVNPARWALGLDGVDASNVHNK